MKKSLLVIFCIMGIGGLLYGESPFTFRANPSMLVPLGPEVKDTTLYSTGGGVLMEGELNFDFLKFIHFGPQFEYELMPLQSANQFLHALNFGGNAGIKLSPLTRTIFRLWGGGGASLGMYDQESSFIPYYAVGADLSFRLTPSLNLGLGGRYLRSSSSGTDVLHNIGVSIGLGYAFQSGTKGAELHYGTDTQDIYPLYYTWYDENPLGEITITNESSEKISNVRASFNVPQYMDQPKYADTVIPVMRKGDSATIPLQGLFTNDIFEINEGLKVAAEVKIEYLYYNREYSESVPLTVQINNKNAMTWDDDRKAACFVTANNPLIYSYARSISGKVRRDAVSALDKNFQIGMGLFESLNLYGLGYVVDPSSAYAELSESSAVVDYIQFPQQTLISQGGDCDDLSVLYAAMLEASGIPAAFITVPGHIYVAYQLGLSETQAKRKFPAADNLIYVDEKPWLPVEVTLVDDGFLYAWQIGAKQIRDNDGEFGFFPVREAWTQYPAAEYESIGLAYLPNPADVMIQHDREIGRFLKQEIAGEVAKVNEEIKEKGNTPILMNKMGVIYARYGFMDDAAVWFKKAVASRNFYPSLINLGNLYYLQNEAGEASEYYSRALSVKPDSEKALVGLARTSSELEDYDTANTALATLTEINPESALAVSHLGTGVGRASAAQNKDIDEWSMEE